jgi:hypothetical protein
MTMSRSASELRIEHSVADQAALAGCFTALYALIAVGIGLGAVVTGQPELLVAGAGFALYLVWWRRRVGRAQASARPWVVLLTPDELHHTSVAGEVRVRRNEAGQVRVRERMGPRMRLQVLEVRSPSGDDLLTVSLPGRAEASAVADVLAAWSWPIAI